MRDASPPSRSRRHFLALAVGTASTTALAGCDGSSPGARTTADSASGESTRTSATDGESLLHDIEDWERYDPEWTAPTDAPTASLTTETLIENLEVPWDLSVAADGTVFITERVGNVLAFDGEDVQQIASPPEAIDAGSVEPGTDESSWWVRGGEGGTLGVAAHPNYPDPPRVYVYYTYKVEENGETARYNRVSTFDVSAESPGETETVVVDGIAGHKVHNGGRITFGPENYLWITCGDGGNGDNAQDHTVLGGNVLRVTAGGDPAPGNPDLGSDADPRIYTYGHRNPQGIVWLPDGTPVISEHGPTGRDEVNRLEAGGNYGWPDVREREAYLDAPDVNRPLVNTGAGGGWAPSGSLFYTGDAVPSLRNRMLTGGLRGQRLLATTLTAPDGERPPAENANVYDQEWTDDAYVATVHERFRDELGRIRHVEQGPDGELYLITSNRDGRAGEGFPTESDDVLVRVRPDGS